MAYWVGVKRSKGGGKRELKSSRLFTGSETASLPAAEGVLLPSHTPATVDNQFPLKILPWVRLLISLTGQSFSRSFLLQSVSWRRDGTSVVVGWMAGRKVIVNGSNATDSDYKKLTQNCEEDNQFYLTPWIFSCDYFHFHLPIFYQYYHGFHVLSSPKWVFLGSLSCSLFLFSLSYLYWCVLVSISREPKPASPPSSHSSFCQFILLSTHRFHHPTSTNWPIGES